MLKRRIQAWQKKDERVFLPLKDARVAHLIYQAGLPIYEDAAQLLGELLGKEGLKICFTAWFDARKLPEVVMNKNEAALLSNKDFNMAHWPKDVQAIHNLNESSDYVIMLGTGDEFKLLSLAAVSPARCRIGPDNEKGRVIFDINYIIAPQSSAETIASEILKVLKMLRNDK